MEEAKKPNSSKKPNMVLLFIGLTFLAVIIYNLLVEKDQYEKIDALQKSIDAISQTSKPEKPTPPAVISAPTPVNLFACATELKALENARNQMQEQITEPLPKYVDCQTKASILNAAISRYLFCLKQE